MIAYLKNLWRAIKGERSATVVKVKEEVVRAVVEEAIEEKQLVANGDEAFFLANRHYLQSIGPKHLQKVFEEMEESEKKDHIAQASNVWGNNAFKREIRHLLGEQTIFVSRECDNWEQQLIGRGTINGIGLVEDRFRELHSMHLGSLEKVDDQEDFTGLI